MKRIENNMHLEGVIRLQERLELLKKKRCRPETVESNNNFTIAMLWNITQC